MVAKRAKDPTRTTLLRKQFITQMNKRFKQLKRDINQLVLIEDAFGLKDSQPFKPLPGIVANRWKFDRNPEKVEGFRNWLQDSVDDGVLESVDGRKVPWLNKFVDSSYRKGITRAYTDTRKVQEVNEPDLFFRGRKAEFLNQAFGTPETVDKLEGLYTRVFSNLEGVTQQMDTVMTRILTQGLADGINPRAMATQLNKQVDISLSRARTIARTEIIHAHSEGQLDSFERLGVKELGILAEWSTAGDDRVCVLCQPQEGKTFTIKEARGLIPLHPNCRCSWIPSEQQAPKTGKVIKEPKTGLPVPAKPKRTPVTQPAIPPVVRRAPPEGITYSGQRTELTDKVWKAANEAREDIKDSSKVVKVGEILRKEAEKNTEVSRLRKIFDTATENFEKELLTSPTDSAEHVRNKLLLEWVKNDTSNNYHNALVTEVQKQLKRTRNFGETKLLFTEKSVQTRAMKKATTYLPDDWTNNVGSMLEVRSKKVARGYFAATRKTSEISGKLRVNIGVSGKVKESVLSTASHELVHAAEYVADTDRLRISQERFLRTRQLTKERSFSKNGRGRNLEITLDTDLPRQYIGREYRESIRADGRTGKSYEVISIGMSNLVSNQIEPNSPTFKDFHKDSNFFSYVIGALAAL